MNKIMLEKELQKLESSYNDIVFEIKNRFKNKEFDVTDEKIVINLGGDAMNVTAIYVDEDDITVIYKYDEIDVITEEIDLKNIKFFDQISILKSLIEKIEDEKINLEEIVSEWR